MRIVIALGGNALLRKGEAPTTKSQRQNVRIAAKAIAPLAKEHEIVISHGNGPQVGLLAMQNSQFGDQSAFPLDVLGAQTEGMIGYLIEQELGNILPFEQPFATILTMVEVDKDDPAFHNPTKPIGPWYSETEAKKLAAKTGWQMKRIGDKFRRVVPSPLPRRIFELRPIRWLLDQGTIVICTGGGGIPTIYNDDGKLVGADVVIDKDYAGALLAHELQADLYIMATDADGVYLNWGKDDQKFLAQLNYNELKQLNLEEGSMKPKVTAGCWFAEKSGKLAAIGALSDLPDIVSGQKGTRITSCMGGTVDF